jgi:hypothetical protein
VIKPSLSIAPSEQVVLQIVSPEHLKAPHVAEPPKLGAHSLNITPLAGGSGVLLTGLSVLLNNGQHQDDHAEAHVGKATSTRSHRTRVEASTTSEAAKSS